MSGRLVSNTKTHDTFVELMQKFKQTHLKKYLLVLERIAEFSKSQFALLNSWPLSNNSRLRIHFTEEQTLVRLFDISNK